MTKRKEERDRIPIDECVPKRLYKLRSRNLTFGIYDGKQGFIGVRLKFTSKNLATEYHWDQGPPFGTVFGVKDTGVDLPDHISLCADPGTADETTGEWVSFDKPIAQGGRGWYFTDTDVASTEIRPVGKSNIQLFDWLMENGADPELDPGKVGNVRIRDLLKKDDDASS